MFCLSLSPLPRQIRTEGHYELPEGSISGKGRERDVTNLLC